MVKLALKSWFTGTDPSGKSPSKNSTFPVGLAPATAAVKVKAWPNFADSVPVARVRVVLVAARSSFLTSWNPLSVAEPPAGPGLTEMRIVPPAAGVMFLKAT